MPPKGAKRTKRAGKAEEPENVAYQKIEVSQNEVQLVACSSAPLAATSVGEKDSAIIDMPITLTRKDDRLLHEMQNFAHDPSQIDAKIDDIVNGLSSLSSIWTICSQDSNILALSLFFVTLFAKHPQLFEKLLTNNEKVLLLVEKSADWLIKNSPLCDWRNAQMVQLLNILFQLILDKPSLRSYLLRFVSLPTWEGLSRMRLAHELERSDAVRSNWTKLSVLRSTDANNNQSGNKGNGKKRKAAVAASIELLSDPSQSLARDAKLIPSILDTLAMALQSITEEASMVYSLNALQLVVHLLSQPLSRRYIAVLVDDKHILALARQASLQFPPQSAIQKQVTLFEETIYSGYDDLTGQSMNAVQIAEEASTRIASLQQVAFIDYPGRLKDLIFSSMGSVSRPDRFEKLIGDLDSEELVDICRKMKLWTDRDDQLHTGNDQLAKDLLKEHICLLTQPRGRFSTTTLYPTEQVLWNSNIVPSQHQTTQQLQLFGLPRLDMQFLNFDDYLRRNFQLYQLESAYEIREDLTLSIAKMQPKQALLSQAVAFTGWDKMSVVVQPGSISVDHVAKPKLGEYAPAAVSCLVNIDLSVFSGQIREEWEDIREHDVVFLVTIARPKGSVEGEESQDELKKFVESYGVKYVRGGEVVDYRDEANNALNIANSSDDSAAINKSKPKSLQHYGTKRRLRLSLDPLQYYADITAGHDCYETFNLLIRRNPRENNFKAVLETIREVGSTSTEVMKRCLPGWLLDVILGKNAPSNACQWNVMSEGKDTEETVIDFGHTFLDIVHIKESFPHVIAPIEGDGSSLYSLKLTRTTASNSGSGEVNIQRIEILPSASRDNATTKGKIRFTKAQVKAIHTAMYPGLSLIIGPAGTGKTDVAVQIIRNLYHSFPSQRIVIVTQSNAALNDIFAKIVALQEEDSNKKKIDMRHLLRLGSGERDLRDHLTTSSTNFSSTSSEEEIFSKQGRVNYCLSRRLHLLNEVQKLAFSLNLHGDFGSSCETAAYFYTMQVKPRLQHFQERKGEFPFAAYFQQHEIVRDEDKVEKVNVIFEELADYRALELLRTPALRGDYLLTKQARIVAMTCKHAAIMRHRLVELGFRYDSLIIEEAGQILDIETVIPMLLQESDPLEGSRLKRVVLLGDHRQLPPIVQHNGLTYPSTANFDQSFFQRMIRLGVPATLLDQQGRARPAISALYNWRYEGLLGDLPLVCNSPAYQVANAGLEYCYQFINVDDFQGKGEVCPAPFQYQNVGEAEYIVAMYQYLRLLGYPAEKITILTAYNQQRQLIREVLRKRCNNALFGMPAMVSTVDRYQGQQNDIILLSLVRTKAVGHMKDIRRLVVALSRARLGLYIFGRLQLFDTCPELSTAMQMLKVYPNQLKLVAGEEYGKINRGVHEEIVDQGRVLAVEDVTAMGILVYQMVQQSQLQQVC